MKMDVAFLIPFADGANVYDCLQLKLTFHFTNLFILLDEIPLTHLMQMHTLYKLKTNPF